MRPEGGRGKQRVLHCNLLLPCEALPLETPPSLKKVGDKAYLTGMIFWVASISLSHSSNIWNSYISIISEQSVVSYHTSLLPVFGFSLGISIIWIKRLSTQEPIGQFLGYNRKKHPIPWRNIILIWTNLIFSLYYRNFFLGHVKLASLLSEVVRFCWNFTALSHLPYEAE